MRNFAVLLTDRIRGDVMTLKFPDKPKTTNSKVIDAGENNVINRVETNVRYLINPSLERKRR